MAFFFSYLSFEFYGAFHGTLLEDLDYADDLGLVSNNFEDAQEKMTRLSKKAKTVGLKVSAKKSKYAGSQESVIG
jgi:hypothetical protein